MTASSGRFEWPDYLIFGATLAISVIIGLYYALRGGGQKTTKEFLLGDRQMPVIPTALSLLVSFLSGILLLGISSEMYVKGPEQIWYLIAVAMAIPMAAVVYLPIFYKLQLTSAYEYLEIRFRSRLIRIIGSLLFIASTLMYTAIVLYAPATALNAVSGFKLEYLILLSGAVCTFYTTVGGLKAVVWTDAFQALVMYAGLIAIVIQGTIAVGSPKKVWDTAYDGGRIFTRWDPNPFVYMNFWVVVIGNAFSWMAIYGTNQTSVQRYTSLSTLKKAQWSLGLVLPGMFTMYPLVLIAGLVMYAYYADCDPLQLKLNVKNRDQLIPHFTVEILGHVKGLPGVFLACLYSGTLSTVSSNLNSLAAVIWEDYIKRTRWGSNRTELQATRINKAIAFTFGLIGIALACTAKHFGGVFNAAITILNALGGPLTGLFLFGFLFPWGNFWGALSGVLTASTLGGWICIGAQILKPYRTNLPSSIAGCSNATLAAAGLAWNATAATPTDDRDLTGIQYIYKLSPQMYGCLAIVTVFVVGIPVSLITGRGKLEDEDVPLIWKGVRYIFCCLPKHWTWLWNNPKQLNEEFKSEKNGCDIGNLNGKIHPSYIQPTDAYQIDFPTSHVFDEKQGSLIMRLPRTEPRSTTSESLILTTTPEPLFNCTMKLPKMMQYKMEQKESKCSLNLEKWCFNLQGNEEENGIKGENDITGCQQTLNDMLKIMVELNFDKVAFYAQLVKFNATCNSAYNDLNCTPYKDNFGGCCCHRNSGDCPATE